MGKWKEIIEDKYLKHLEELTKELKKEKQKIYVLTEEEAKEFYKNLEEEQKEEDILETFRRLF